MKIVLRVAEPAEHVATIKAIKALHEAGMNIIAARDAVNAAIKQYFAQEATRGSQLRPIGEDDVAVAIRDDAVFTTMNALKAAGIEAILTGDAPSTKN